MSVQRLGNRRPSDYTWPGFVDALASLLMVFVFVLMVFVLIQANLAYRLSGKDASLSALRDELRTISSLLGKERDKTAELSSALQQSNNALEKAQNDILSLSAALAASKDNAADQLAQLQALNAQLTRQAARTKALEDSLEQAQAQLRDSQTAFAALSAQKQELEDTIESKTQALSDQEALSEEKSLEIERLIAATLLLRNELNELRALLAEKEAQSLEDKVTIASLGKSLNEALASRVQELARFKSNFFGRLRDILGKRGDVTIVGDRFIFQSEVLFDQGKASLGSDGTAQLDQIGTALLEISETIPKDIPWVLQVDGHTDDVPVSGVYADNWELSTERALSVVRYLIDQGVPASRLAATGYGEFQPIAKGISLDARQRNRRIELKFTQRLTQN